MVFGDRFLFVLFIDLEVSIYRFVGCGRFVIRLFFLVGEGGEVSGFGNVFVVWCIRSSKINKYCDCIFSLD